MARTVVGGGDEEMGEEEEDGLERGRRPGRRIYAAEEGVEYVLPERAAQLVHHLHITAHAHIIAHVRHG